MERQVEEKMVAGSIIGFIIGAVIGGLTTYFATKKKIKAKADKEIEEVRDIYEKMTLEHKKEKEKEKKKEEEEPVKNDKVKVMHHRILTESEKKAEESKKDIPEIIPIESFVEDDDYDKETLIFYEEDGVLTDQYDHVVGLNETIGEESLNHFGEEEEDIVYVRNSKLMIDYEVILEHKASPPTALAEGDEDDD